jgi:Fe-S-cluster containining protein
MEITLDLAFVRSILAQESARARNEIRNDGVQRAYENSQHRHDARIASAPDVGTLACRAGCTWCCYFSVDVRAVEVFSILDFMERELTAEDRARIQSEIRSNSSALRGLDEIERMQRNVKCPFLNEGRCTIYAARPQMCRNYHATDAAGCQKSYEEPGNLEIDPEFAPYVYQAGSAHVDAFSKAMRDSGFDDGVYELNVALDTALSEAGARQRFASKLSAFASLSGKDAPYEFEDLEED